MITYPDNLPIADLRRVTEQHLRIERLLSETAHLDDADPIRREAIRAATLHMDAATDLGIRFGDNR